LIACAPAIPSQSTNPSLTSSACCGIHLKGSRGGIVFCSNQDAAGIAAQPSNPPASTLASVAAIPACSPKLTIITVTATPAFAAVTSCSASSAFAAFAPFGFKHDIGQEGVNLQDDRATMGSGTARPSIASTHGVVSPSTSLCTIVVPKIAICLLAVTSCRCDTSVSSIKTFAAVRAA
jgi:hypothetical protein